MNILNILKLLYLQPTVSVGLNCIVQNVLNCLIEPLFQIIPGTQSVHCKIALEETYVLFEDMNINLIT